MRFRGFVVAGIALVVLTTDVSIALAKPHVSLALPPTGNAGVATSFAYTTRGLSSSSRLVLQRQQGTARVWRTVASLAKARTGASSLPGLTLGIYRIRIAAIARRGKVVAEQPRTIEIFGEVPFTTLFALGYETHSAELSGANIPGVYTTPGRTFNYDFETFANENQSSTVITVGNNTCRSVHIDFVPGLTGSESAPYYQSSSATLSVIQQSLDPVVSTAGFSTFGALDAQLVPGESWSVTTFGNSKSIHVYVNGSAVCYRSGPLTRP